MSRRQPAWYQREPYSTVVQVLLDHGLLTEGGTASLRLSDRVVVAERSARPQDGPVESVAARLFVEGLTDSVAAGLQAARDIVDALVEWRAPGPAQPDQQGGDGR